MSQLDATEETLGDHNFTIHRLDPLKSLAALNVVKDSVAGALGSALGSIESAGELAGILDDPAIGSKLGGAVERLFAGATMDRQKFLIETFVEVSHVDGKPMRGGVFDLTFRGDLPLLFAWLKAAFIGEWGNVGRAIVSGITDAIALHESQQKSPPTSEPAGPLST